MSYFTNWNPSRNYMMLKTAARIKSDAEDPERDLIRRYRAGDPWALSKLIMDYRGLLNKAIQDSGISSVCGYDQAYQLAQNEFINIIKDKLDLSNTAAQPKTFIYNSVKGFLSNEKNRQRSGAVRMGENLRRIENFINISENHLSRQLGRTPTDKEIVQYGKKYLGVTDKTFKEDTVNRIRGYKIEEWSGSARYGDNESNGGAEAIDFNEAMTKKKSPLQIMNEQAKEKQISTEIDLFTNKLNERRYLKQSYRIGPYKDLKQSKSALLINNALSNYQAKKLMTEFKAHLIKKGLI